MFTVRYRDLAVSVSHKLRDSSGDRILTFRIDDTEGRSSSYLLRSGLKFPFIGNKSTLDVCDLVVVHKLGVLVKNPLLRRNPR